jgi:hypothetical protein
MDFALLAHRGGFIYQQEDIIGIIYDMPGSFCFCLSFLHLYLVVKKRPWLRDKNKKFCGHTLLRPYARKIQVKTQCH